MEMGIKTVAVYSTADKNALHVRFADEAVCIGPPEPEESYLNIPRIIATAEITNAEAIHPGDGYLAENAEFAEICFDSKLVFIGPDPTMIKSTENKFLFKQHIKNIGLPVIPGSEDYIKNHKDAEQIIEQFGFPVVLKSAYGREGMGISIIHRIEDLEKAMQNLREKSQKIFGNNQIYIEKFIKGARHIGIQILGDKSGNIVHLGERDCTIQRNNKKLLEECPSPFLDITLREQMGNDAIMLAKSIKYTGAGTVEFLIDPDKNFYVTEMNTRLQAEHPITEEVFHIDIVKEQIRIANGNRLLKKKTIPTGHSIECRIFAESPDKDKLPTGTITTYHPPGGNGIRIDSSCYSGFVINPLNEPLIAKIIVIAGDRESAIKRMLRSLDEFIVEGVNTNKSIFKKILTDPKFKSYNYDTEYFETQ